MTTINVTVNILNRFIPHVSILFVAMEILFHRKGTKNYPNTKKKYRFSIYFLMKKENGVSVDTPFYIQTAILDNQFILQRLRHK